MNSWPTESSFSQAHWPVDQQIVDARSVEVHRVGEESLDHQMGRRSDGMDAAGDGSAVNGLVDRLLVDVHRLWSNSSANVTISSRAILYVSNASVPPTSMSP